MASPPGPAGPQQSSPKPDKDVLGAIKKIGKYEIQKKIGAGGMGAVYLALDPFLKRNCALKVLPQEKAKNPTLVRRFRSEAEQAAKLRHENIVAVFEANEADGFLYIALEYVEGTDVAALVQKRGLIPLKRSIEIVRQAAQALEHAHQQGIVHRDIKPGNLLVRRDGVVKLADLGLARNLDDVDTSITRAGTTVGTVDYMAPEQARDSKAADVRSDMYSLGCTWYFMLTGEPPFPEGSLTNKLRSHAESPLPDPRQKNPSVTEAVVGVLRRMTEKKPSKRYQTPAELLEDLDGSALTGDAVSNTILEDESDDTDYASGRSTDDDAAPRRAPPRSAEPVDEAVDAGDAAEGGGFWSRRKKKKKDAKRDEADSDESVAADDGRRKSKPPKRSADDGAPAFKPPPGRDAKDKSKLLEPDKKVKNNAALFYALVGLVVFGAVAGVIWAVGEYNSSSGVSGDRTANPFAQRDAVAKQAGPNSATGAPANVSGTATSVGPGPNAGTQLNTTTVGGGNPTAPGVGQPGTVVGPPGGDPGRLTSRIGGDGSGASAGPSGTNAEAGGDSATGSNPSASGQGATGAGNTGAGNATGGSPTATSGSPSTGTKTTKIGGDATTTGTSGSGTAGTLSGSPAGKSPTGNRPANQPSAARIAQEHKAVPYWANEKRPVDGLPVLTVDPAGKGEGTFATLNKALEQAPAGGACIKLVGSGPFTLFATKIVDKKRIVIEPRDGNAADPPVVILLPAEEASTSSFLETVQTTLDLRQIHLALDATDFTTDPDDSILAAVSSDLYLQNCSISVKGRPESPMTAIKVSGKVTRPDAKAGVQPRVLIDQTLVRGNNVTALTVNGEHADLVCRGSLLWSGAAPAVRFGTIARGDADSSRVVRLVSSTLCALKAAIVVGGDAGQPCPTTFEMVNSLVAAPTGGDGFWN
ncbi:MAG: protein kinase [Planctomycetia bacterium]|nr:protein kinase [Planctomycetia bacterium]